jgi:hypothetical protein
MWQECVCGHHRSHHPWLGYGTYGCRTGYAGCGLCQDCGKPSSEHVFVTHQFNRCTCLEYLEVK